MISLTEFYLSDKSKQTQMIIDSNTEISKLKQGYCPIKEKCNKGECDCTNEEYNSMCEENIKLDLEIERLKEALLDINDVLNSDADVNPFCEWQVNEIADIVEKVDE